jgi:hypothetical protein
MGVFSHDRSLTWAVLLAGVVTALGEDNVWPSPGIFEVDLLFPRNETYAPNPLMPIVFALQNPTMASVNGLIATVDWELWEGNNRTSAGSVPDGDIDFPLLNLTASDPLLFPFSINTFDYPDGSWTFAWSLNIFNCTIADGEPHTPEGFTKINAKSIVFTTSKSGQATDLVAATSADKCAAAESFVFNVTAWGAQCGVLGPSPTANPCAATIGSAAAASISAAATDFACAPLQRPLNPNVTCPTPSASKSAGSPRMAAPSTFFALLATLTTLLHLG